MKKKSLWNFLIALVRHTPIISGLVNSRPRDHFTASRELFITLIFTTLPLWVGGFIAVLIEAATLESFWKTIQLSISNGDLFLYSTSILAPIVYIAICDAQGHKEFPSKTSHTMFVIIIVVLASVAFAVKRVGMDLNQVSVYKTSTALFLVSSILLYIAMVFKSRLIPESTEEIMKSSETEFLKQIRAHRS